MTITEIENLFNLVALNMPELNFYHFGWFNEVNDRNLKNNHNPPINGNKVGSIKYPALYVELDSGELQAPLSFGDRFGYTSRFVLKFVDVQKQDEPKINSNRSEIWTKLQLIAAKFFGIYNEVNAQTRKNFFLRNLTFENDSDAWTPVLCTLTFSVNVNYVANFDDCFDKDEDTDILINQIITTINTEAEFKTDSIENNFNAID